MMTVDGVLLVLLGGGLVGCGVVIGIKLMTWRA
jgi:hypothetical protein